MSENLNNEPETAENTEPAESAEPIEFAESVESAEPAEPAEPVESAEPESEIKPVKKVRFKDSVPGTAVILGIVAMVTVFAIAFMNSITAPLIEEKLAGEKAAAIAQLFGAGAKAVVLTGFEDIYLNFPAPITEVLTVFESDGIGGEKITGYCVTVSPKGFTDDIIMIVAVNADITVQNTLILSMKETAGYGSKIDSGSDSWFREQFKKKKRSIEELQVEPSPDENAVQIIAGATVTSRAFVRGVNAALDVVGEIAGRQKNAAEKTENENENAEDDDYAKGEDAGE